MSSTAQALREPGPGCLGGGDVAAQRLEHGNALRSYGPECSTLAIGQEDRPDAYSWRRAMNLRFNVFLRGQL